MDRAQQLEILCQALRQLDPELRNIFLLREIDRFSYQQIAEVLQISEATVAARLSQARHHLYQILKELGWDG